jgi:DNA polymerase III alpha subunit
VLEETLGVILFQEQVLKVAREVLQARKLLREASGRAGE